MSEFTEFFYDSADGIHSIHARVCVPEGEVKGIIQIAHGIAEHIERYYRFMTFMADNGYIVVGNDHLGHGQSYKVLGDKGYFADKNGWGIVVTDMLKLHDIMSAQNPGVKYIMFGHSMGSFLTRTYLICYPDMYDLAILSGTGHMMMAKVLGGAAIADICTKRFGAKISGDTLCSVAFGTYLNRIPNPRTEYDWLTTVDEEVDKYIADENCGFTCKNGLYRDMMRGLKFITVNSNIKRMNKNKPVYFMSGSEDPVGDWGKGVTNAYKAFCKVGLRDVTLKLYEGGRHEMLNESNHDEVMSDILDWINSKV